MIAYGTSQLERLRRVLAGEATLVPFFRSIDMKSEQEAHAFDRGFDGGRELSPPTIRARAKRWGYYRKVKRSRVSSSRPFAVWTGRYLRSTYGEGAGRKRIRPGLMTIRAMSNRPVRNPWDLQSIDRKLGASLRERLQRVFDGKRGARRVALGRVQA